MIKGFNEPKARATARGGLWCIGGSDEATNDKGKVFDGHRP